MFTCFIFVYNTGDTISTVNTIDTIFTFFYLDIYTVSTINTVSAVFTVDTNFTIFTIFTCYSDSFRFKVFIKFNVDSCVTICILTDDSFNVFAAVLSISFSAFALNFYSGTKFISFHTARVSVEFQAFVDQCVSCIFKVSSVYRTVLSFVISSCCINFV